MKRIKEYHIIGCTDVHTQQISPGKGESIIEVLRTLVTGPIMGTRKTSFKIFKVFTTYHIPIKSA